MKFSYPIVILSFNRPRLLEAFLTTLKAQTMEIDETQIFLFQDGLRSKFNTNSVGDDDAIQKECVAVFKSIFPTGKVFHSNVNLGIALNFDRAETYVFNDLAAEAAAFFEDDMVLSPHYLTALSQLVSFALSHPKVGYVAAYGDHHANLDNQSRNPSRIIPMHHKWGFALTRRQWLAQKPIIDPYLEIVRQREYTKRDHARIKAYFRELGYESPGTSQDAAKDVACLALGVAKLMCAVCYGKYIGAEGTHFRQELYDKLGFVKTELWPDPPVAFDFPSVENISEMVQAQAKSFKVAEKAMRARFRTPQASLSMLFA